jgi:hypothetical protein
LFPFGDPSLDQSDMFVLQANALVNVSLTVALTSTDWWIGARVPFHVVDVYRLFAARHVVELGDFEMSPIRTVCPSNEIDKVVRAFTHGKGTLRALQHYHY